MQNRLTDTKNKLALIQREREGKGTKQGCGVQEMQTNMYEKDKQYV